MEGDGQVDPFPFQQTEGITVEQVEIKLSARVEKKRFPPGREAFNHRGGLFQEGELGLGEILRERPEGVPFRFPVIKDDSGEAEILLNQLRESGQNAAHGMACRDPSDHLIQE